MHFSLRHRISRLIPVLSLVALLAVCSTSTSLASTPKPRAKPKHAVLLLGGTWVGKYSGSYSGTFTIHWRQTSAGTLRGSIKLSNPPGTYGITGKVQRGAISFGVVGAGATYTGSATRTSMSGHYRTARGGGSWSARKTS